ncbi:MAG: hypothetical protein HQK51_07760 [Oligoflexia bacterium]|nr:hypothetical protein [Oligoflexia bacterium]
MIPLSTKAEIDFKLLKGSSEFLQLKEECNYLAPHIPLTLLRQGKLNNEYIYGDEKDPVIKLIKTAFNSVSENPAFFQVSPLAENVAKFLPPSAIGKILGKLKVATATTSTKPLTALDLVKDVEENKDFKALVAKEDEIIKKKAEDRLKEYEQTSEDSKLKARLEKEIKESLEKYAQEKEQKMKELAIKE